MESLIDYLITLQLWFEYGFAKVSILLGIISFAGVIITTITVKGIYVPLWWIPVIGVTALTGCILTGYVYEKYGLGGKMISRQNRNWNPEFVKVCADIEKIKKKLEINE